MNINDPVLLVVVTPATLKDKFVDMLMEQEYLSGFSLSKIQGFSSQNSHYNVKEQVEGYKDVYRFEILHAGEHTQALLKHITTSSGAGAVRYWLTPVLQHG